LTPVAVPPRTRPAKLPPASISSRFAVPVKVTALPRTLITVPALTSVLPEASK
jgi:hypothetical protein